MCSGTVFEALCRFDLPVVELQRQSVTSAIFFFIQLVVLTLLVDYCHVTVNEGESEADGWEQRTISNVH